MYICLCIMCVPAGEAFDFLELELQMAVRCDIVDDD